jgi:hypothetical protein
MQYCILHLYLVSLFCYRFVSWFRWSFLCRVTCAVSPPTQSSFREVDRKGNGSIRKVLMWLFIARWEGFYHNILTSLGVILMILWFRFFVILVFLERVRRNIDTSYIMYWITSYCWLYVDTSSCRNSRNETPSISWLSWHPRTLSVRSRCIVEVICGVYLEIECIEKQRE